MGTVADKLDLLLGTKAAIRQSITGKGQTITDTDPFSSYAAKIDAIETGVQLPELEDPGSAADLLAGKQLVDQYGNPLTGTMPQKSAGDLTASGASIIVPAGYYPSQVSKSVATATHPNPTISRSGGTVTAQHVQSAGYTSGGTTTETLTIPTQAAKTVTPTTYAQTAVASGRLTTGAVTVAGDANLAAGNIRQGVSIFGVAGTLNAQITTQYTITNAHSSNITLSVTGLYSSEQQVSPGATVQITVALNEVVFIKNITNSLNIAVNTLSGILQLNGAFGLFLCTKIVDYNPSIRII